MYQTSCVIKSLNRDIAYFVRPNPWKSLTGDNSKNKDKGQNDPKKEELKAIKMVKELQKKERESEQLHIDPRTSVRRTREKATATCRRIKSG